MRWIVALALCVCGCAPAERAWSIWLPPSGQPAARIEYEVRPGFCSGDGEIVFRVSFAIGEVGVRPPPLAPGQYAISARAIDDSCDVFARGCVDVQLPAAEAFELALAAVEVERVCSVHESCQPEAVCAPIACAAGESTTCSGGIAFSCVAGHADPAGPAHTCLGGCDGLRCAAYTPLHWTPEVGFPDTLPLALIETQALRLEWLGRSADGLYACGELGCSLIHDLTPGVSDGVAVVLQADGDEQRLWVMVGGLVNTQLIDVTSSIPVVIWSRTAIENALVFASAASEPSAAPDERARGGAGGSACGLGGAGGAAGGAPDAPTPITGTALSVGGQGRGAQGGWAGGALELVAPGVSLALAAAPGRGGGGGTAGTGGSGGGAGGSLAFDVGVHSITMQGIYVGGGGGGGGGDGVSGAHGIDDTLEPAAAGGPGGDGGSGGDGSDETGSGGDGEADRRAGGGGGGGGGHVTIRRLGPAPEVEVFGTSCVSILGD